VIPGAPRLATCGLLALAIAGCSGRVLPRDLALRESVAASRYATGGTASGSGLWFYRAPQILPFTFDGERRTAVLTSVDPWTWRGIVPRGGELHAGVQILPQGWRIIRGLRAWVVARSGGEREVIDVVQTSERLHPQWLDFTADLSRWAGREVTLEFHAALDGLPPENRHGNVVAWGPVRLSAPTDRRRPNVLFILVDTLRFDHLTPYGYRRDTSPNIARTLAKPGAVVENAYAQAPWTLPSVVSFMTSRQPGEILGDDAAAYGIPPEVPTLAEAMARRGYETGGFFGNRILHAGNGFAGGFDTFFSPASDPAADDNQPDAAAVDRRVLPWLEAHRNQPFFLYVHYIDPHDPYDNPEIVDNRSPFETAPCPGCVPGRYMQGVYAGKIPLDPARDTEHLKALYDSEIHYADRFIGRLIDAIPPEVLRNTLIVLTADHGEEFHEHGGWKHGFTLYEEQIHVPLLVRWDGHVPAGSRLRGTVRLLDLAPTLVRVVGGRVEPTWEGVDLLPALQRRSPLPRLAAFAQHMMIGPLRTAAVLDGRKLILFNPRTPYTPTNDLEAYLWTQDLHRLRRVELYDLARDAQERNNLALSVAAAEDVDRMQPILHRQLDRELPGLRVFLAGFPAGARVQGTIALGRLPTGWDSYFLAEGDRVELAGNRVTFDLGGETLEKGFRLEGDFGGVQTVEARVDGRPLAAGQVRVGPGTPYPGGALSSKALTAGDLPTANGPALLLWLPGGRRAPAHAAPNPETETRLRALGYVQ
jgi:arylsulfatase A-like enzyme